MWQYLLKMKLLSVSTTGYWRRLLEFPVPFRKDSEVATNPMEFATSWTASPSITTCWALSFCVESRRRCSEETRRQESSQSFATGQRIHAHLIVHKSRAQAFYNGLKNPLIYSCITIRLLLLIHEQIIKQNTVLLEVRSADHQADPVAPSTRPLPGYHVNHLIESKGKSKEHARSLLWWTKYT